MDKQPFNTMVENAVRSFRDSVLEKNIRYLDERIAATRQSEPKLSQLLQNLRDATRNKQDKRKTFETDPEFAEEIIQREQQLIIEISQEIDAEYPEEFDKLQAHDREMKRLN